MKRGEIGAVGFVMGAQGGGFRAERVEPLLALKWRDGHGDFHQVAAAHCFVPSHGSPTSLAMAIFGEVVCALLVALGLFTRGAAAVLAITMATAFFLVHKGALSGPGSGELAFVYLAGWVAQVARRGGDFGVQLGNLIADSLSVCRRAEGVVAAMRTMNCKNVTSASGLDSILGTARFL